LTSRAFDLIVVDVGFGENPGPAYSPEHNSA
jgi:hypothetical protein